MSGVQHLTVKAADAEMRLDRWFHGKFPHVGHGRLSKLLRTGQIRLDGKRCKAGDRLGAGQTVRLPPLPDADEQAAEPRRGWTPSERDLDDLAQCVIHSDDHVLVLDKPAGLAVQGGTATERHLDAMLDGLRFGVEERPRLVHRLDRDTSGVLLLARTAQAARALHKSFKGRDAEKTYWALVAGAPDPAGGCILLPLLKKGRAGGERVQVDMEEGQRAATRMRTLDHAGGKAAWLELKPLTGRTHQLRAHCAAIGHPILGDGKYGGRQAFFDRQAVARRVHLHARSICIPHPSGGVLHATAPLPADLRKSWDFFGFALENDK
ncbi:MAG: RluA family pseudouridine synthase [Rhodospirillales bacterium]|nr:RluA family pseudouridine synthase [Rhodospirillales bacterium]